MGKMFSWITKTWNPLGGECLHQCSYCWARKTQEKFALQKYLGKPRLFVKEFKHNFKETDFVFVCDMTDLFGAWVPSDMIQHILDRINLSQATFLLLTKNPSRYSEFEIPPNCVCGATIESDLDHELTGPPRDTRIKAMINLQHPRKMVSIEPIMQFSPEFLLKIRMIQPEFVALGYDNYNNGLPEPKLEITEILISGLELSTKVYRKTIREKRKD
jgi:protein gp37